MHLIFLGHFVLLLVKFSILEQSMGESIAKVQ